MQNKSLLVWDPGSGFKSEINVPKSLSFALPELLCSSVPSMGSGRSKSSPPGLPNVLSGHTHPARGQGDEGRRDLTPCYRSCGYFFLQCVFIERLLCA